MADPYDASLTDLGALSTGQIFQLFQHVAIYEADFTPSFLDITSQYGLRLSLINI